MRSVKKESKGFQLTYSIGDVNGAQTIDGLTVRRILYSGENNRLVKKLNKQRRRAKWPERIDFSTTGAKMAW